jgi:hypothetical protein
MGMICVQKTGENSARLRLRLGLSIESRLVCSALINPAREIFSKLNEAGLILSEIGSSVSL